MTTIKMVDCKQCIVCGERIGKGKDPAVCGEDCKYWYEVECEYNKWAKQQSKDNS